MKLLLVKKDSWHLSFFISDSRKTTVLDKKLANYLIKFENRLAEAAVAVPTPLMSQQSADYKITENRIRQRLIEAAVRRLTHTKYNDELLARTAADAACPLDGVRVVDMSRAWRTL